jgi:hypothetical protein
MHDTDDHPWQPYWNDDYSTDNNAGSTYFNLTDGQIMDCQFFDTNYISYFAHDSTRPLARNIFVSGRKGPAASASVPTLAPSTAGTVPTSAPATAETEPTVAPTPSVTTSMRGLKGFDYGLSPTLTASDFDCMVENGFEFFVQRGFVTWNTSHRGVIDIVDPNLCMHLRRAHSAGLDIKGIYLQPRPRFGILYSTVVLSLKQELMRKCRPFSNVPVYLSILDSANNFVNIGWKDDQHKNRNWLEGFLSACKMNFESCGVLSSESAWATVFGEATFSRHVAEGVSLWYSDDGSEANFQDYESHAFGGFFQPRMKQYVRYSSNICDIQVGLDWTRQKKH